MRQKFEDVLLLRNFVDISYIQIRKRELSNSTTGLRRQQIDVIGEYDRSVKVEIYSDVSERHSYPTIADPTFLAPPTALYNPTS